MDMGLWSENNRPPEIFIGRPPSSDGSHRSGKTVPGPREDEPLRYALHDPVEATADVTHQRVTAREDRRRSNRLESAHRPQSLFEKPMVALDAVGSIPPGPMQNARHCRGQRGRIADCLVGDDPTWRRSTGGDGLLEERARGNQVACGRHIGVYDLSVAVDGAIDVVPTAADASVSLVNSPIEPNRLAIFSACLTEQRQETLNPAVDR